MIDKIVKKLPFYQIFFHGLCDQEIILDNDEILQNPSSLLYYENFNNDETGKKLRINLNKVYCVILEEAISYILRMKKETPNNHYFYNVLKLVYKSSGPTDEVQLLNKKNNSMI